MSAIYVVQTVVEIFFALLVIWCFINEKRLIRFEDKVWAYIVYRYRRYKKIKARQKLDRINARSVYSPKRASDEPLHVA